MCRDSITGTINTHTFILSEKNICFVCMVSYGVSDTFPLQCSELNRCESTAMARRPCVPRDIHSVIQIKYFIFSLLSLLMSVSVCVFPAFLFLIEMLKYATDKRQRPTTICGDRSPVILSMSNILFLFLLLLPYFSLSLSAYCLYTDWRSCGTPYVCNVCVCAKRWFLVFIFTAQYSALSICMSNDIRM